MNFEKLLNPFGHSYVYFPFLGAGFVFGLLLLFYRDLNCITRDILVPAIAVYMIGTSLIGYAYHELDVRNCVKANAEKRDPLPQPFWVTLLFWFTHLIWIGCFIVYLFKKDVL